MRISDWSSDVCSSDLLQGAGRVLLGGLRALLRLLARQVRLGLARDAPRRHQVVGGEEARHAVARQGADRQPVLGTLDVEHQALRVVLRDHRVVGADALDEAAVARSEEHTSELQSLMRISYAVFCLTK